MSSQYYDKDQVDQKLSQNLDRVEEVGKEVKLDVTKDVKAEVDIFTASTTTKVNTLEGKVNQLDSKTTELNSSVAVYNQKVDNLNSAVSSETSSISIKPTDTATYLATLPNAVYRAASAGTYQFTTLPDFNVVVNKVVPEGYSVKFLKDSNGWSVSVVEKLPTDIPSTDKINKGKAYPYVNQTASTAVTNINNVILNVEIEEYSHSSTLQFAITLITRKYTTNNWGNAIHVRVLNSDTLEQSSSWSWKSTDTTLTASELFQINKISAGGIQRISLFNKAYNKWFHITIDTDAINDNQLIDASYTNSANKMYFNQNVYKIVDDYTKVATKLELTNTMSSLSDLNINKGKSYPFVNQPTSTVVDTVNNIFLNCKILEESSDSNYLYSVSLIAKNNTTGGIWGNAIVIKRLKKADLTNDSSYTLSTIKSTLSSEDLIQINKLSAGGVQTITFYNKVWNKWFYITIDTDAINDGQMIDISYTNNSNTMYFSSKVYEKMIVKTDDFALKAEVSVLNSINLNSGKSFPFLNQPTDTIITTVNSFMLDCKIYGGDYDNYTYSIVGIYKGNTTFGDGLVIARTRKSDNLRSYNYYYTTDRDGNYTTAEVKSQLIKISSGGIQTIEFTTQSGFGGFDIVLILNTDLIPNSYTAFGASSNEDKWINHIITPANYLKKQQTTQTSGSLYNSYDTFKDALRAKDANLIKVGNILAVNKSSSINLTGDNSSYYPSQVGEQYNVMGSSYSPPKTNSQLMTILNEEGTAIKFRSFGKRYMYFGEGSFLYRTQDEFKNDINTYENTVYERLIIPSELPDSVISSSGALCVFELDNGELLIEVRNGLMEDPNETDYKARRVQLYLTNGLKNVVPTINSKGIKEFNLVGILAKVHEYKSYTGTISYQGTTFSTSGSKIAIAPYGLGLKGLVHYSNDYGKTWKVIFNMGVEDDTFAVPYKGSNGAYPNPSDLIPQMPTDMWTAGGNTNFHVHGVTIDPFYDRIWVSTGDATSNFQGRTALWYSDDEGRNWVRMQTRGTNVLDSVWGLQPMGVLAHKDYVLVGSDSSTDGLYRYTRKNKTEVPKLEPIYWYKDEYNTNLRVIYGGSVITNEGFVYSVFFPNRPTNWNKGVVVYSCDGINWQEVYFDELNTEVADNPILMDWGTFIGKDNKNNIYVANSSGTLIRLY